MKLGLLARR